MTPYEAGRLARVRNCYRALCVATDAERAEWFRGYDDMDAELKRAETDPRPAPDPLTPAR